MTNGPINLTKIDQMPVGIRKTLSRQKADLRSNLLLEGLLENPELERVIEDLNTVCLLSGVVGIHYTRAMPEQIAKEGLVAISGFKRRTEFLDEFGDLFTERQRQKIVTAWEGYFTPTQSASRDGKVWFNFTDFALVQGGAEELTTFYGGESIYKPLINIREVREILANLGQPMIVRCSLKTERLKVFVDKPWGKVWLSTYHSYINPDSFSFDIDAYCEGSVHGSAIRQICFLQDTTGLDNAAAGKH